MKATKSVITASPKGKMVAVKKVVKAVTAKSKVKKVIAKKVTVKKPVAKKAVKIALAKEVTMVAKPVAKSTDKKIVSKNKAIQVATSRAIQPMKQMAIIVPPTPSGRTGDDVAHTWGTRQRRGRPQRGWR